MKEFNINPLLLLKYYFYILKNNKNQRRSVLFKKTQDFNLKLTEIDSYGVLIFMF